MDKLDCLLLDAWRRISASVRYERLAARRRSRRRFMKILTTPMREACLVIRASDTRINDYRAIVLPAPDAECSKNLIESHQPHIVTLDGKLIRDLTKPVHIPWPGVTYQQAADICGREYNTIQKWVAAGVFQVEHYREHGFPEFNKRAKPRKQTGTPDLKTRSGRPYVWTPSPIDPNNFEGRTPHAIWGTLWQWLWEDFPENYELTVTRVPRMRGKANSLFSGWEFLCPGRLMYANEASELDAPALDARTNADAPPCANVHSNAIANANANAHNLIHIPCGRRCMYLYGPMTFPTIARALSEDEGFDILSEEDSTSTSPTTSPATSPKTSPYPRLAGQWFPGLSDPIPRPRSFACKDCWEVRTTQTCNRYGWNHFITYISGGLLYGHEVPRPLDIFPIQRRKPVWKKKRSDWKGWKETQRPAAEPVADKQVTSG